MICKQINKLLPLYLDNQLDERNTKLVEAHLSLCTSCITEYRELKKLHNICGSLVDVPVPKCLKERIKIGIEANASMPVHKEFPTWAKNWRLYGGVAAAVFAIFLVTGPFYSSYINSKNASTIVQNTTTTPVPGTGSQAVVEPVQELPTSQSVLATPNANINIETSTDQPTPQEQIPTLNPAQTNQPINEELSQKPNTNVLYDTPVVTDGSKEKEMPIISPPPKDTFVAKSVEQVIVPKSQENNTTAQPSAVSRGGSAGITTFSQTRALLNNVTTVSVDIKSKEMLTQWLTSNIPTYKTLTSKSVIPVSEAEFNKFIEYIQNNNVGTYKTNNISSMSDDLKKQFKNPDGFYIVIKSE